MYVCIPERIDVLRNAGLVLDIGQLLVFINKDTCIQKIGNSRYVALCYILPVSNVNKQGWYRIKLNTYCAVGNLGNSL